MMRRISLLAAFTVTLVWLVGAQATTGGQSPAEIEKQILEIEGERDQAMQKRDIATLDRLHADDFVFVNTRGQLLSKAQYLEDIRSGNLKFLTFEMGDYRFHIYGDTVIMNGRASSVVEYHGKVNRVPRRFTSVYVKLQGQWRLVAHQATLIAEQ
jgi:ketosteroid isomerase-like protein